MLDDAVFAVAARHPESTNAKAAGVASGVWRSVMPWLAPLILVAVWQYSDAIRDALIAQKRSYHLKPVTDTAFIGQLQTAANWLSDRHVLPQPITITEHLVSV